MQNEFLQCLTALWHDQEPTALRRAINASSTGWRPATSLFVLAHVVAGLTVDSWKRDGIGGSRTAGPQTAEGRTAGDSGRAGDPRRVHGGERIVGLVYRRLPVHRGLEILGLRLVGIGETGFVKLFRRRLVEIAIRRLLRVGRAELSPGGIEPGPGKRPGT